VSLSSRNRRLESSNSVPAVLRVDDGVSLRLETLTLNGDISENDDADSALAPLLQVQRSQRERGRESSRGKSPELLFTQVYRSPEERKEEKRGETNLVKLEVLGGGLSARVEVLLVVRAEALSHGLAGRV
jgi:hypothetical protein